MIRFLKSTFLIIIFLLALAYTLLQSPPVQKYIITKITVSLEEKIGTKVKIGDVNISFFHGVKLGEVFIGDNRQDTIIYASAINLDINDLNLNNNKLHINYIELVKANIKIIRHKGDKRFAYLVFLDNFKSKNKSTTKSADWLVDVKEIKLTDCVFQNIDENRKRDTTQFDDGYLRFSEINSSIKNLIVLGDTARMNISRLSTLEQCGFRINDMSSSFTIAPGEFNFGSLNVVTPFSRITDQFIMRFDSTDDFDDFISKIKLEGHFDKSVISFDDLQFFSSDLRGMHQKINLSGVAKGTIDNLKWKNVTAHFGQHSYFKGSLAIKGLPDLYETFFDISTKDALIEKADLDYLLANVLPDEITQFGKINYQMKAVGFLRDFVVDGNFITAAGNIRTDINFKFPQNKIESYSGTAVFNKFNLGLLVGSKSIETLDGSVTVNGSGLAVKTINTKIDANLNSLMWNHYNYKNIIAHGTIADKLFTGKALVNDENLNLDFDGTIDYSKDESIFDFKAKISNANLKVLHIDSSNSVLNAELQMKLHGTNISNIYGEAQIPLISYAVNGKEYKFLNLSLNSNIIANRRSINVTSDAFDASIDGNYNFNDLVDAIGNEGNLLYPDYFRHTEKVSKQDFVFIADLKKPEAFIELIDPNLSMKPTRFNGYFNSESHSFALNLKSNQLNYTGFQFDTIVLTSEKKSGAPLNIHCSTKKINQEGSLWATETAVEAVCNSNKILCNLNIQDKTTSNKLKLEGNADFMNEGIGISLTNSQGNFNSVDFNFTTGAPLLLNKAGMAFTNFKIKSAEQEILVNGRLSNKVDDQLHFSIHNFELTTLNNIIKNMGVDLVGVMNGNFTIANPLKSVYFATDSGDLVVRNFGLDRDTFGNFKIHSTYSKGENLIHSSLNFFDCDLRNVSMEGIIDPSKKNNYLDFKLHVDSTPVRVLNFVFKGLAHQLEGTMKGEVQLTGSFDNPNFEGKAFINNASFTVDYLKTTYKLTNEIQIHRNSFEISNAKLYDENKRAASIAIKITHTKFAKWGVNVYLKNLLNFKILNTTLRDNDLFYGVAYATGDISIVGPVENIKMVMNLKSNKGTVINIPLTNPEYSSKSSYITFKDKSQKGYKKYQVKQDGLELEMHLDINEDAYLKLIFDSQLGDIIEGTGNGNITMSISATGDFSMYGYYEIMNGKYVFTKYDVFNKPFIVKSGGRISWDGSPYEAKVNLEAVYLVSQANATSLLQSTAVQGNNDAAYIPVNCILFLKGLLFKPDITFNLEIQKQQNFGNPQLENTVKTYIASWQQNPDELNRQVFSLLFFKRFFPLNDAASNIGINSGINTSVGDLITSQLSNFLGQVFNNVPIGIDYNKSDTKPAGVWVFKYSQKVLKDRLLLEADYIYDQTQSSNLTGNISAQVMLDRNGQIRCTIFSKRANNSFTYNQNVLTNGVGFYWRREFNTFRRKKKTTPFTEDATNVN